MWLCFFFFFFFYIVYCSLFFFFFFQAEDGIRDFHVTGVQTCALPILPVARRNGMVKRARMLAVVALLTMACSAPANLTGEISVAGKSAEARRDVEVILLPAS